MGLMQQQPLGNKQNKNKSWIKEQIRQGMKN